MKKTIVTVYKNGKPSRGRRVSLEFIALLSGGFTKDFYTNASGEASISHESEGSVKVYVDGNHNSHRTTGRAPGHIVVHL